VIIPNIFIERQLEGSGAGALRVIIEAGLEGSHGCQTASIDPGLFAPPPGAVNLIGKRLLL
jgi:hypothetical protein